MIDSLIPGLGEPKREDDGHLAVPASPSERRASEGKGGGGEVGGVIVVVP